MLAHMQNRAILLVAILCAALMATLLLLSRFTKEPYYNGKPLSHWLLAYWEGHEDRDHAILTLEQLDTNALPYLIEWIEYDPPAWRHAFARRVRSIPLHALFAPVADRIQNTRREQLAESSVTAFACLGPKAARAIDPLVSLMNKGPPRYLAESNTGSGLSRDRLAWAAP
jgi:hypothetical protein